MDTDFAVSCPLVRRWRLISGFCPSSRTFDPCFFQTPPRGGSPCIITRPSPPSGWPEDFHLQAAEHAQHTTKPTAVGRRFACPGTAVGFPVIRIRLTELSGHKVGPMAQLAKSHAGEQLPQWKTSHLRSADVPPQPSPNYPQGPNINCDRFNLQSNFMPNRTASFIAPYRNHRGQQPRVGCECP